MIKIKDSEYRSVEFKQLIKKGIDEPLSAVLSMSDKSNSTFAVITEDLFDLLTRSSISNIPAFIGFYVDETTAEECIDQENRSRNLWLIADRVTLYLEDKKLFVMSGRRFEEIMEQFESSDKSTWNRDDADAYESMKVFS